MPQSLLASQIKSCSYPARCEMMYDAGRISRTRILSLVDRAEAAMPALEGLKIPTRIVRLADPLMLNCVGPVMMSRPAFPY